MGFKIFQKEGNNARQDKNAKDDFHRKEDGEAHDEEAGKTGVVDDVEHRYLH